MALSMLRKNKSLIGFTWAGWTFDFFDLILYSFLLMGIQQEFGLTNYQVGLIYSVSLATTAVGGVVLGFLGDKLGRRWAIIISVTIFSVGTLLSGLAYSLSSLLMFRIITGFGIGGEWAAGHTLINETLPKQERGRASSIIQSGAPVGAALASVMGGFVTPFIGWRYSFILASFPSFILVLLMIKYLPESPQYLIFKAESNDVRENEIPQGADYIRTVTKRSMADLKELRKPLVLGSFLSLFGMLAYWVIFSWTPKYLGDQGYTEAAVGWWMILSQLGAFIGYLSFGIITSKLNQFRSVFTGFTIVFALGVILFSSATVLEMTYLALFGIFVTGLGTGFFSGYGPIYSRLFPVRVRNTSASWCFNIGRLGAFMAPLLVASLASLYGFPIAIASGSVFAIAAGLWVFLIPEQKLELEAKITKEKQEKIPIKIHV